MYLEDVPPDGAPLDESMLTEGAHIGLLARVGHSVVSVRRVLIWLEDAMQVQGNSVMKYG